jgi:hypothetical protein
MSDVSQIELSIEHAKGLVAKRDLALKLGSNREFKKLIIDGYFVEEAARLAGLSADPQMLQHRDDIFDAIKAISHFRQFMQNIVRMGDVAAGSLADHEAELEEARLEEMEG